MKNILIILALFIFGCSDAEDTDTNTSTNSETQTDTSTAYIPLVINLAGENGVLKSTGDSMDLSVPFLGINLAVGNNCKTAGDMGTGVYDSIVNDPDRCITAFEKVDSTGGHLKVIETVDTSPDSGPMRIVSVNVEKCYIIKTDGSTFETPNCPDKKGIFKNDKFLNRISPTKLEGISGGNIVEYDQVNETSTIVLSDISGDIAQYERMAHANVDQIIYKVGSSVKRVSGGVTNVITQLENKEWHKLKKIIQIKAGGNLLKRIHFNDDGIPIQDIYGFAIGNAPSNPVEFGIWNANPSSSKGPPPYGPVMNSSLSNCDKSVINGTTIALCNGGVYKYTDKDSDLELINICALGNCGQPDSVSCMTSEYYYLFSAWPTIYRLTRIHIANETSIQIYDLAASGNEDYNLISMACGSDTVTGMTDIKTVLITNANTSPSIDIIDTAVEELIPN